MLLIGSRAILFHLPNFRAPKDWDLLASEAELERLAKVLPPVKWRPRPGDKAPPKAPNQPDDHKHFFVYQGNTVEVERVAFIPLRKRIYDYFADAPVIVDPVLGPLRVPSLDFLLLTKQCGLVFPIAHWHKNLRDAYVLRDAIAKTSPDAVALWQTIREHSAQMYRENHAKRNHPLRCCHPQVNPPEDMDLHRRLHARVAGGERSFDAVLADWTPDAEAPREQRVAAMIAQISEEAQVVAADRMHAYLRAHPQTPTTDAILQEATTRWLRWALREMAIGPLPIEWRYFIVNHYREIRDAVPPRWGLALRDVIVPA